MIGPQYCLSGVTPLVYCTNRKHVTGNDAMDHRIVPIDYGNENDNVQDVKSYCWIYCTPSSGEAKTGKTLLTISVYSFKTGKYRAPRQGSLTAVKKCRGHLEKK